ncbi:DedD protein [Noviherbaspirillum humi]|uniref:DedD protein n=1 Tax=Noviherbaspirillum humi TaxID=1688639 RepID=A0A239KS13_9BURK|nr:SPOR domain-containing protein [Noviherbaspirillum humi]SNT20830.1 DedD protein [Noviherbaspirillum humi]
MSLLSFLRKNKQEAASTESKYVSRSEAASATPNRSRSRRKSSDKSDAPLDPVLPEKKRARRRLIGAVALVLAAIIGLPMILDSEPKPLSDDIAVQIPSKDKPAAQPAPQPKSSSPTTSQADVSSTVPQTAALDPKEEVVEPPSMPPVAASKQASPSPAKSAEPHAASEKTKAAAKPADEPEKHAEHAAKPATVAKPESAVAAKSGDVAKSSIDANAKKAEKPQDSARAVALLEGKNDPKHATDRKPGNFVIQVAALASRDKASEVQGKLKDAGIKSYTEKVSTDGGERIRVRVGPFGSKEEADKVKQKLNKLGLNGSLLPA